MDETRTFDRDGKGGEAFFLLNRRQFLKLGGGIFVFFSFGTSDAQQRPPAQRLPDDINAFLRIGEDGRVSLFTGKVELGQGIVTSLAQMLAEELDVALDRVDMVMGDTDLCPWDAGTFGSMTTRFFAPPMREAAAEARAVLIGLGAERLRVREEDLKTADGMVVDRANPDKRVSYAELTRGRRIERRSVRKAEPKPYPAFSVSGRSPARTDGPLKVTGKARYTGDLRFPDMLYARIVRPPAHGAKLRSVDTSAAEKAPGVRIVRDGDLIAVLHPLPDGAEKALALVKAEFDLPDAKLDEKTIYPHLLRVAPEGQVVTQGGDLKQGENLASEVFEGTFYDHYMAHAPIETHSALARMEQDRMTVWISTQTPFRAKEDIVRALAVPPEQVRVIVPFVGGGFGGKSESRQAVEAARLAKLTGRPVQVARTRQEEFFYDTFRPAAVAKIRSGTNGEGRIVFWAFDTYFAGPRGIEQFFDIPHHIESSHGHYTGMPGAHPFATGPWRAPGSNFNTFARESQIDVMAAKHGVDPLAFRLKNLKDPRMIAVLSAVSERFGWTGSKSPSGRGIGLACAVDAGAYVAVIAEVEVDPATAKVRVRRLVCCQEMGQVINPDGALMQLEGGLMMGLGYALTEEVRFRGGEILDRNFDTYEIPRFSWLPKIEAFIVPNPSVSPQGGGEPPIVCVGGAIANAIFDRTGARLHDLPMTAERVKAAMAQVRK